MNNPSVVEEKEIARKEQLEKLGLTEENIANNKKLISVVDEEKANELGEKLVKLIGKKGYDENNDTTYQEVLTLIKDGANLSFESSKGNFPLLFCARKGYIKTFITLLKFGANAHQVNKNKTTIVMSSARHGYPEILCISLLMGVDVNVIDYEGETALVMAKRHGMKECFEILIDHNAILNIKNYLNLTSYEIKNEDGEDNIDEAKYYSQVPKNPVLEVTHEDAIDLINEAKLKLCTISESLDVPINEEPQTDGNITFETYDLPDEMTQSNINLDFKVR